MQARHSLTMRSLMFSAALIVAQLAAPAGAQSSTEGDAPLSRFRIESLEEAIKPVAAANPRKIEAATGGRLGIALVDREGNLLIGFNREERFAMCSTFKAPLAAAVLMGAEKGRYGMDGTLPVTQADLLDYAPVVKANLKKGRMAIADLAKAAVEVSDNSAANLLLPLVGGPDGLTAFLRAHGDALTRLDRTEPALNENAPDDPRDTTSPVAMATVMARLLFQDMPAAAAARLRGWMEASSTGAARIRAGTPADWTVGSKTGTCGTAYNDVAILRSPSGRDYVLAIYLDRPTVDAKAAEAGIAEAARAAITIVTEIERRNAEGPPA
ncbi:class A beta-lactamase [Sphingobium algorifonticola]|uniref:Beta-lactamase n=1 Tax=Sphingobium algorifonticola TaxID=2008318 RepID=A0A437J745_9SPHN|nr:class A beta-lactamase [Sphingobium algorifonticola]RVT40857.1 class A beta-lactamase [Sphingobium algorifonticola]